VLKASLAKHHGITATSSILTHLLETGHTVDVLTAFKPIYEVPIKMPKLARIRLLSTAEAIAIRIFIPELCIQKRFVQALALNWPESHLSSTRDPQLLR
jgi:hypothetical protein